MTAFGMVRPLRDGEVGAWLTLRNAAYGSNADESDPEVQRAVAWRMPFVRVLEVDDALAAAATWYPFGAWIGGVHVATGALAAVASAPPARRRGHVRALIQDGLRELEQTGVGWSGEHPFDPAFYDAMGYRRVPSSRVLDLPYDRLPGRARDVEFAPVPRTDPVLREIRRAFASQRSFALDRDDPPDLGADDDGLPNRWSKVFEEPNDKASPGTAYLCDGGYAIVATEGFGPDGLLHALDLAWTGPAGRARVLALLRAWEGQVGRVRLELPADDPLSRRDGDTHGRHRTPLQVRIVDLAAALAPLRGPADAFGTSVIEVRDDLAMWNDGRWRIEVGPDGCTVRPTRDLPHATLEIGALTALIGGTPPAALVASGEAEGAVDALRPLYSLTLDHPPFHGLADYY